MTYTLDIDIHEHLEDAIDGTLGGVDEAVEEIRKRARSGPAVHREEVDVHDLLAQHHAIALIWDADMLLSHYPHLTRDQAWEVLKECERNYKGEEGLAWDDIAMAVTEMFPDPADILAERVGRFEQALGGYDREEFGEIDALADLLADARHWCDAKKKSFAEISNQAYQHYLNERDRKEARP